MPLDIDSLLAEISPDSPCGEDISYDPQLMELEKMASGKADTQFSEGEEPDWRGVRSLALELLGRSKHLRVMVLLTAANVRLEGSAGLRDGLRLLGTAVERLWDKLWPALDPEDDNDPTERLNIIAALSPPKDSFADPLKFKQYVMDIPLASSRVLGKFTLRDGMKATGELPPAKDSGVEKGTDISTLGNILQESDPAEVAALVQAWKDSAAELQRIDRILTERAGSGRAANFETLAWLLRCANLYLAKHAAGGEAPEGDAAPAAEADAAPAAGRAPAAPPPLSGEIRTIADVNKAIDKICEFYQKNEPSSPVPILLKRAKRLVGKTFDQLLKDLTPSGLRELQVFTGDEE